MTSPLYTDLRKRSRPPGQEKRSISAPSSAWTGTLPLTISGIRIEIGCLPPALDQALRRRFSPFVSRPEDEDEADLTVSVRPSLVRNYLEFDRTNGSKLYRLETRARERRLHLWSFAFAGWFEIDGAEGEISLCESDLEPPARSVENFLRVAFAWKAVQKGGLLLHASGLVRGGKAYVFFGPSGSGKTTVTRLSGGELLLNDDCIHITRRNGQFFASGVPFKGREDRGAENAGAFPIGGMFRLVQARRVACERMSAARAVAELASSVPFVSERSEGLEAAFSTIEQLVRAVPVGRLWFRLAPDFWNAIEEASRG